MRYTKGQRVRTPAGLGTIAYERLAAPDYTEAEAVSVVLDGETRAGYVGTIFRAATVEPLPLAPRADDERWEFPDLRDAELQVSNARAALAAATTTKARRIAAEDLEFWTNKSAMLFAAKGRATP